MKVLIACEKSQRVCMAFRERGHEAYSCDIQKCTGGGAKMAYFNGRKSGHKRWPYAVTNG